MDDMNLVRDYVAGQSDDAFAILVQRHTGLVYSAALRQCNDVDLAEEVTQTVFIILARKCHSFGPNTMLAGWPIPAGEYQLTINIKELVTNTLGSDKHFNEGKDLGSLTMVVVVPATSAGTVDTPLDLGLVEL